jgi:hypothetical protein
MFQFFQGMDASMHNYLKRGFVVSGLAMLAMGMNRPCKAADGIILTADATVFPDARYLLTTPSDAKVLQAPAFGSAHFPEPDLPTDPIALSQLTASWSVGDGDPNAVALVQYDPSVIDAINTKDKRAKLYDRFLIDYGLAGIDPLSGNLPWLWEPDPAKQAAAKGAVDWVKQSTSDLKALRASLHGMTTPGPLPTWAQELKASAIAGSPTTAALTDPDWRTIIDKALVYGIRQQLKLNDTLVEMGPGDTADLPPNYSKWGQYSSNSQLEFYVGRTLNGDKFGDTNLQNFLTYWSTVSDNDLYSDDDVNFLRALASENAPKVQAADSSKLDWRQTAQTLISDCKDAADRLLKWRSVTYEALVNHSTVTQLRAIDPSLADATFKDLSVAADTAAALGQARPELGRLAASSPMAIQWLADQTRRNWFYSGKLIRVVEKLGDFGGGIVVGPTSLRHFVLREYNHRDPIELPEPTDGTIWRELQGNTAGDLTNYDQLPDKDPFGPLVWQTVLTLTPTTAGTSGESSADDLYAAGRLVDIFAADLRGKLVQAAADVRAYGAALLDQYDSDIKALRYGQFVTPEPAIVEAVYVTAGASIKVGDAIATVRPTYRYRMQLRVDATGDLGQLVQPGSPVKVRLACGGPIGTTAAEKTMILADSRKAELLSWLSKVKQNYLADTDFTAEVTGVDSSQASVGSSAPRHLTVQLSLEIPASKRTIPIELLPSTGALGNDTSALLASLKFPVNTEDGGSPQKKSLSLDAGPLSIGETCKTTVLAAAQPETDGLDLARRWSAAAPK